MFTPTHGFGRLAAFVRLGRQAAFKSQDVSEIQLHRPSELQGSTHELVTIPDAIYITGQNMHCVAKVTYEGGSHLLVVYQ